MLTIASIILRQFVLVFNFSFNFNDVYLIEKKILSVILKVREKYLIDLFIIEDELKKYT